MNSDGPVLPSDWVEFEYSDPDPDAVAEEVNRLKQGWHKLHAPVDKGIDEERGPYDVIPLSMVRGGEAKPHTVYKTPMKHLVLDQTIPPRGWYKSKIEADRVRPRPCYSEALLTSPFLGFCPVGCSALADTMISTPDGPKPIQDFQVGDLVYGRFDWGVEPTQVLATISHKSSGYYNIKLSNDQELKITAAHLVWELGKSWVDVKELYDTNRKIKFESLQNVRQTYSDQNQSLLQHMLTDTAIGNFKIPQRAETFSRSKAKYIEWPKRSYIIGGNETQNRGEESQPVCGNFRKITPSSIRQETAHGRIQTSSQPTYERQQLQSALQEGQTTFGKEQTGYIQRQQGANSFRLYQAENTPNFDREEIASRACSEYNEKFGKQWACRIQTFEKGEIYNQRWSDTELPFQLGVESSSIFGRSEPELAIRNRSDSFGERSLPARFFNTQRCWQYHSENYRSEGLLPSRRPSQVREVCESPDCPGHSFGIMGRIETEGIEYTLGDVSIISIEYIEGEVDVYDIQTVSENFYASGVLNHNSFCYINNGSRGYRATGIPTVDPEYPEKYHKQLKKVMVAGAGYMTSFSEAFHKLEDTYHVTERLTNVFVEEGLPIFYCTRRLPAEWAIDALQVNPYSYMQFSINTSVHDDFRKLSPGSAKLEDTFRMIERLRKLNIYTSIQCNPMHPGITSLDEIKDLVNILASVGNNHIIFKFVEQVANARKVIVDRLYDRKFKPEKVDLFDKLFNQVIGGVYTIQQDVRIAWLEELLAETRKVGMTMSLCYEYYENGGAGTNLAPYFTTSDQCHGRGIPIHYRPALGEKFKPLPGCYRKGCLYCAEYGTKSCRNEQLQQALALEYGIANKIQLVGNDEDWNLPESCARPEYEINSLNRNPELLTDAELWGWIPKYTKESEINNHIPAIEQHSGSREMIDISDWKVIS